MGWRSHSEIAHYARLRGRFKFPDLALGGMGKDTWDKYGIHNPAIHKVGNKYVLLYISNNKYRRPPYPSNQCIGMMTAESPYGPWKKVGKEGMILAPSTNPKHWTYKATNGLTSLPSMIFLLKMCVCGVIRRVLAFMPSFMLLLIYIICIKIYFIFRTNFMTDFIINLVILRRNLI